MLKTFGFEQVVDPIALNYMRKCYDITEQNLLIALQIVSVNSRIYIFNRSATSSVHFELIHTVNRNCNSFLGERKF